MGRISIYNHVVRAKLIELAYKGYTDIKICELLGINKNTLANWKKNKPKLRDNMRQAKKESAKHLLEVSTRKLASGYKLEERTTETIELDNNNKPMKVTTKIREVAPDIKAMELIANKYAPEYNNGIDIEKGESLNVTVNYNGMTFADLIEHRKANNPLDAIPVDYKLIKEDK